MDENQEESQGGQDMDFRQGVNTMINILGHLIKNRIEEDLVGNDNVQEIADLLNNIGGELGRIDELLGEQEQIVAPNQDDMQQEE